MPSLNLKLEKGVLLHIMIAAPRLDLSLEYLNPSLVSRSAGEPCQSLCFRPLSLMLALSGHH